MAYALLTTFINEIDNTIMSSGALRIIQHVNEMLQVCRYVIIHYIFRWQNIKRFQLKYQYIFITYTKTLELEEEI